MNRLTIELPERIYQQLIKQAEKQQKLPERLAAEKLIAEFGVAVRNKDQAKKIARHFLTRAIGTALEPQSLLPH